MEAAKAKMLGNRMRLNNNAGGSSDWSDEPQHDGGSTLSLDEILMSKCHSMCDVSTGSDSVFLALECPASYDLPMAQHAGQPSDLGVASIFAQSVLSGYLQSHRQSISDVIQAIGGCPIDDDVTPVQSDEEDDQEVVPVIPRHLSFSSVLSPIEENGETPTSESVTLMHSLKVPSTTDLISASSMEELKEFLMLETLYTA